MRGHAPVSRGVESHRKRVFHRSSAAKLAFGTARPVFTTRLPSVQWFAEMKQRTITGLVLIDFDGLVLLTIAYAVGETSMPLWYMVSREVLMLWAVLLGVAGPVVLGYAISQMRPLSTANMTQRIIFVVSSAVIVLYTLGVFCGVVESAVDSVAPNVIY